MQARNALNTIVAHSGYSKTDVARLMGRNDNYIRRFISGGNTPRTDILAEVADVCGYDLALIRRDGSERIIIDPPEK